MLWSCCQKSVCRLEPALSAVLLQENTYIRTPDGRGGKTHTRFGSVILQNSPSVRDTEEIPKEAGTYLMMVCMPRTCGVFSSTLSVFGRGCPWWAEARAALQQGSSDQSCTAYAHRATTPDPPRVGHSPRPKDGSSQRTHRTGWTPESASSSLGKSQVWYQVRNPRAVPPRRTGTNLPRPHTQQSAASARPSLCLHPGSESSSSAQARPCYAPWDRAARAAPRHEDRPTKARGPSHRGWLHRVPENTEDCPGHFSHRREQHGAIQCSGQEPHSRKGQCGEPVTRIKHSCGGTGHGAASSHSEATPKKPHAGQSPRQSRKSSCARASRQSSGQQGQRRGRTRGRAGAGSPPPPAQEPAPLRLAGSPCT